MSDKTNELELLKGAYDIHIHSSPDVMSRIQDAVDLGEDAREAGMAGLGLKDHTTSTTGRVYILNRTFPQGPKFYSSITLNPTVGGLNPLAVEAALREGADFVYFPTYSSREHLLKSGPGVFSSPLPLPKGNYKGITILDSAGKIKSVVHEIIDLIAEYDAILATGHLSSNDRDDHFDGIKRLAAELNCVRGVDVIP